MAGIIYGLGSGALIYGAIIFIFFLIVAITVVE